MGYIYNTKELKTKQDYIDVLNEINSYRELDGQDFDFGTGLLINEMSYGSEDAYYEMDIQTLEDIIDYWDFDNEISKFFTLRPHKYSRKRSYKLKYKRLSENDWFPVWDKGSYLKRYYRGRRSSFLKKASSKKIRQCTDDFQFKGNKHKRVFDFWWELD
jgi:hypothetical protein